jgi:ferrochelatase
VPVSFVSDHVETLGEIDHEARAEAAELGLGQFEMTAGLNDSPKFIEALAHLVKKATTRESLALTTQENVAAPLMAAD